VQIVVADPGEILRQIERLYGQEESESFSEILKELGADKKTPSRTAKVNITRRGPESACSQQQGSRTSQSDLGERLRQPRVLAGLIHFCAIFCPRPVLLRFRKNFRFPPVRKSRSIWRKISPGSATTICTSRFAAIEFHPCARGQRIGHRNLKCAVIQTDWQALIHLRDFGGKQLQDFRREIFTILQLDNFRAERRGDDMQDVIQFHDAEILQYLDCRRGIAL